MNTTTKSNYLKFKSAGLYRDRFCAMDAWNNAKILDEWNAMERAGIVRIRSTEETDSYFDVYGKPDTKEEMDAIVEELNSKGCWHVKTEFLNMHGQWEHADSIGMCIFNFPDDPFDNPYVIDLMRECLRRLDNDRDDAACAV